LRRYFVLLTFIFALFALPASAQDPVLPVPAVAAAEAPSATAPAVPAAPVAETPVAEAPATPAAEEVASVTPAEVEEAVEGAAEVVDEVVAATRAHAWPIVIGIFLVAIVAVLRKIGIEATLPKGSKALPWLTLALAAVANVGAALLGQMEWGAVLTATLTSAGIAMGSFDLTKLFKKTVSTPSSPAPEG
jgi:hypothetical protein